MGSEEKKSTEDVPSLLEDEGKEEKVVEEVEEVKEVPEITEKIPESDRPKIFTLKTAIGHERSVVDAIEVKAKRVKADVYAIIAPTTLRGYVFIEAMSGDTLNTLVKRITHARGLIRVKEERGDQLVETFGTVAIDDKELGDGTKEFGIAHLLTPKPLISGLSEGDIVEIISGPFRGEKARVQKIDETREEVTIELFESLVNIPVTIRGDQVRVIEKG